VSELAERGIVLDVCPVSNVRLGIVASLAAHPLPRLVAAGVRCSISTDDPTLFGTDLTLDYEAAVSLGLEPRSLIRLDSDGGSGLAEFREDEAVADIEFGQGQQ